MTQQTLPQRTVVSTYVGIPVAPQVRIYILGCLANPDPGSEFDQKLTKSRLMELPEDQRLERLLQAGYLALLYLDGDEVIAHAFLQRHGEELHLFSLEVSEGRRGQDLGWAVALDLIDFARASGEISRVRLSKGEHGYFAQYLIPRLADEQLRLRLSVDGSSGFVTLTA